MPGMTIGRFAKAAGTNVETIRFYQRIGLIAAPAKPSGGVRRYVGGDVIRVRFIRRAQELGFTLAEIRSLMSLAIAQNCGAAQALAKQKLESVESRIADLSRMRSALVGLIARCDRQRGRVSCPIIKALTGNDD